MQNNFSRNQSGQYGRGKGNRRGNFGGNSRGNRGGNRGGHGGGSGTTPGKFNVGQARFMGSKSTGGFGGGNFNQQQTRNLGSTQQQGGGYGSNFGAQDPSAERMQLQRRLRDLEEQQMMQEYQRLEEDMMRKRRMMDMQRGPAKYPRMGDMHGPPARASFGQSFGGGRGFAPNRNQSRSPRGQTPKRGGQNLGGNRGGASWGASRGTPRGSPRGRGVGQRGGGRMDRKRTASFSSSPSGGNMTRHSPGMKYGAKKRGGPGVGKSPIENKHTKEEFDLLTHLLQTSARISRPEKKEDEAKEEEKNGDSTESEVKMEEGGEAKEADASGDAATKGTDEKKEEESKAEGGEEGEDEETKETPDIQNLEGTPITTNNTVVHQVKLLRMFRMEFFMYDKVLKDLHCYICNVPCWAWPNYWSHLESKKHKENVGSVKTDFGTNRRVALARELSALSSIFGPKEAEKDETGTTEVKTEDAEKADSEKTEEEEDAVTEEESADTSKEQTEATPAEEATETPTNTEDKKTTDEVQDLTKDDYYFVCRVCLSINPGPAQAHLDCVKHKYLEKKQDWCEDCNLYFNRGRKFIHHFQTALHQKMCALKGKPVEVPASSEDAKAKDATAKGAKGDAKDATKSDEPVGMKFAQHGLWCKLCTIFYPSGDCTKRHHCSSKEHREKFNEWLANKEQEEAAAKGVEIKSEAVDVKTEEPAANMETNEEAAEEGNDDADDDAILGDDAEGDDVTEGDAEEMLEETVEEEPPKEEVKKPVVTPKTSRGRGRGRGRGRAGRK